ARGSRAGTRAVFALRPAGARWTQGAPLDDRRCRGADGRWGRAGGVVVPGARAAAFRGGQPRVELGGRGRLLAVGVARRSGGSAILRRKSGLAGGAVACA